MKKLNPLLEDLKAILPAIAANAAQAEKDRKAPDENIALLKGIGMHRAFQPKHYGGMEISLPQFADCVVALAGACASTAWAFSLLCTHSHQLAMFSKQLQDEIWGDNPDATASSSIAPFGKVEETEGGVIFNGEMGWSSGSEIRDDWFAAGMKGSGTKTLIIKDVFVPNHRIQQAKDMMEGRSAGFGLYPDSKIFYTPYRPYFASGFAAIGLGIAERMLEAYREKTKNRVRAYTGVNVGTATPALMRLAESTHQVAAARAFLEKTWQEHAEHGERHQYPSRETLAFRRTR